MSAEEQVGLAVEASDAVLVQTDEEEARDITESTTTALVAAAAEGVATAREPESAELEDREVASVQSEGGIRARTDVLPTPASAAVPPSHAVTVVTRGGRVTDLWRCVWGGPVDEHRERLGLHGG